MPTFKNVTAEVTIDVDFEVFCGRCGAGLCNNSNTDQRRISGYHQVTVDPCDNCMKDKEDEIEELSLRIEALEDELNEERKKK